MAVVNIIKSLRLAGKGTWRTPKFLDSAAIVRIIKHDAARTEIELLAYIPYLFAIRLPSGALVIRRSFKRDVLDGFPHQSERALIGLRDIPRRIRIILRFPRRGNLSHERILPRPSFCQISGVSAQQLRPAIALWPLIVPRVRSGQRLIPSPIAANTNATIKAAVGKLGYGHPEGYSARGTHRGAANEPNLNGSQWPTVATSGEWRPLSLSGYGDVASDIARDTSMLLIAKGDNLSGDDEIPVHTLGA